MSGIKIIKKADIVVAKEDEGKVIIIGRIQKLL